MVVEDREMFAAAELFKLLPRLLMENLPKQFPSFGATGLVRLFRRL